jgi:putative tryptophan/tyrosine transport system substrate-binding protein
VTSLARPGGNITDVLIAPEGTLAGKKLELLKEAVPRAMRIALLAPVDPNFSRQVQEVQKAA